MSADSDTVQAEIELIARSVGELRIAMSALVRRVEHLEAHAANQDRAIERVQ